MRKLLILFLSLLFCVACNVYQPIAEAEPLVDGFWKTRVIPESPQDTTGDPVAGFDYLIHGDYIGSGVPVGIMRKAAPNMEESKFEPYPRNELNKGIPYNMTAFVASNGAPVANGNCFTCHAGQVDGELIIGLGDSFSDYESSMVTAGKAMRLGMGLQFKKDDPYLIAWEDFGRYFQVMAPRIQTTQPGANPAFRLAEACMMHRNPEDLTYSEDPLFEMWEYNIATDTPPLWHVKKKSNLYYTGIGRGDMPKLLLQASVLGVPDSSHSRKSVEHFKDVYAWLLELEAPEYPGPIDGKLVAEGEELFQLKCASCHGTYEEGNETYPNKVVNLNVIKTDRLYADYIRQSGIVDWYNASWFARSEPKSAFVPNDGYVAPPLDGVWASAPYFHNGSVPTLYEVLSSEDRPERWTRLGLSTDYDWKKIGWHYDPEPRNKKWTFDTNEPGYGKEGHYFGDELTEEEKWAVIEYLKTL